MAGKKSVQRLLHVAPRGNDRSAGTAKAPFKTIERARDAVRKINSDMTGDIVVSLAPGTYELGRTLTFDHRDSGMNGHDVVYRAAGKGDVVVSGGRKVTGWKPDTDGRWKARTDVANFRQLYVNGRRVVRAFGPVPRGLEQVGCIGYSLNKLSHHDFHMVSVPSQSPGIASWKHVEDVEFVYRSAWTHPRVRVTHITQTASQYFIHMAEPAFTLACFKEGAQIGAPDYIENALELLDKPAQWYLDRHDHWVYYYPKADEPMDKAEVIAPALEVLVELKGTPDQPVHNMRFEGLTFSYATWLTPNDGFVDVQANFRTGRDVKLFVRKQHGIMILHGEMPKSPANVICRTAKAVQFQKCIFTHLGGAGLDLECGAQDNVVNDCEFCDISGTGIQVGDVQKNDHHPDDPRLIVKNNRVANSRIHDIGVEYEGSQGVFVGYTEATMIAHNEIYNVPHSAIGLGWGWGEVDAGGGAHELPWHYDTPTTAKNNVIEGNHIHHVVMRLMDGAAIYTLGRQPGTVIRGNNIHDADAFPGGIYLDEGTADVEVTQNRITRLRPWTIALGVKEELVTHIFLNNKPQDRDQTCRVHDNEGKVFINNCESIEPWKGQQGKGNSQ